MWRLGNVLVSLKPLKKYWINSLVRKKTKMHSSNNFAPFVHTVNLFYHHETFASILKTLSAMFQFFVFQLWLARMIPDPLWTSLCMNAVASKLRPCCEMSNCCKAMRSSELTEISRKPHESGVVVVRPEPTWRILLKELDSVWLERLYRGKLQVMPDFDGIMAQSTCFI